MADVLARSSNIGAINIGLQVGDRNLYNYIRRFGFGKREVVLHRNRFLLRIPQE